MLDRPLINFAKDCQSWSKLCQQLARFPSYRQRFLQFNMILYSFAVSFRSKSLPSRSVSIVRQSLPCAHSSAHGFFYRDPVTSRGGGGWATCFSAEHGVWSSPPFCEPRQQACYRDRVVAGRLRLGFANNLGGVAPPSFCSGGDSFFFTMCFSSWTRSRRRARSA